MRKLFCILPAYNEEENIKILILSWLKEADRLLASNYDLLILPVDDGSKDHTKEIICKIAETETRVVPLIHKKNLGLGAGVNTGLEYFCKNGENKDFAVIMDADNTHEPRYVHSMLKKAEVGNLDCVIASRYCHQSKTVGVPGFRQFLSLGARIYYTFILRVKNVKDYTCGYRVYSHEIVKRGYETYGSNLVCEKGFSCMMEVLYKLYRIGGVFGEVPFELRYDQKLGESKMRVGKTILQSLKTALKLRISVPKIKD